MKQALEEYYREVEEKAEEFAQEEVMCRRYDHVRAFNLGRLAQRVEKSRHETWLRVLWLFLGLTIGLACGGMYPDSLYSLLAHKVITKANVVVRSAGRGGFNSLWKNLRA